MSKQEKIREGIKTLIAIEQSGGGFDGNRLTQKILEFEDMVGVVIKVDRELPEQPSFTSYPKDRSDGRPNMTYQIFKAGQRSLIDAGYVAVNPLIEEKK